MEIVASNNTPQQIYDIIFEICCSAGITEGAFGNL
jgi:hypothetical protein